MPLMEVRRFLAVIAAFALCAVPLHVGASKKTVCTITVNSPDEKDFLARTLSPGEYQFVELVERGRPDWLASACRAGVKCDVLLISGHFDGGTQFYSDRLHVDEYLPVDEMERVACSDSCPGLFSQLKEVYLFGCNTLNAEPMRTAGREIERSLVRAGYSKADAASLARVLGVRHAESNRERMRNVFKDVPLIYGFSSKAPLGPYAAATLQKHFQPGVASEFGSGRVNASLLGLFAPVSMTAVGGATDDDPYAGFRRDVCQFSDDRLSAAQKVSFVHQVLRREVAEVRMLFDHVERYANSLSDAQLRHPAVRKALDAIAADDASRLKYLEFARDADEASVRTRMLAVAHRLGWLTADEHRAEHVRMIAEHLAGTAIGSGEVDLFCAMNKDRALGEAVRRLPLPATQSDRVAQAAVLACHGSSQGRARVLRALIGADDTDIAIAQVLLRHRPLEDANELRLVATGITRMHGSDAQVRALDTLARHHLSDLATLQELIRLFGLAKSVNVQRAIAGVLIRADFGPIGRPELARSLRAHRLKSPDGQDLIDVLIRRLLAAG
ncbi:MAG TPA: hypothetical protein VNE58_05115 [Casimicrobiaceae bacterium]|nr:hypothetical protein [Casimicrobiaceae bacterium]